MSALVITGTGYVGPDGSGPVPVPADDAGAAPGPSACLAADFDPEREVGRRTARFNHRSTLLAIAACGAALRDAGLDVTEQSRDGIGVSLGTMCGSVSGSTRFGWDTFEQPRPYNVNPASFPNLVINTAAGAVAIKHGLRGANCTVAGGPLAGINALRHAALTLRAGHADTILVGASEEYGVYEAWLAATARPGALLGEGAAILVLERAAAALAGGRAPVAALGAAITRAIDAADASEVRDMILDALEAAEVPPERVRRLAVRTTGCAAVDAAAVAAAAVVPVRPAYSEHLIGDCYTAHAAVQLADTVAAARELRWGPHDAGVVLAVDPDGLAGAAVLTGPHATTRGSGHAAED